MARIPKQKKRKIKREPSFAELNGGGCEPYNIKCENCGLIQPGGEQYHFPNFQITPCFNCGGLTALYEPQVRQST